jgi:hypothetical protein
VMVRQVNVCIHFEGLVCDKNPGTLSGLFEFVFVLSSNMTQACKGIKRQTSEYHC